MLNRTRRWIRGALFMGAAAFVMAAGTAWSLPAGGTPDYAKGCERPLQGVNVCWEVTAGDGSFYAPYERVRLLPVSRRIAGSDEMLGGMTRNIYRQIVPSGLADRADIYWHPALSLNEAMIVSEREIDGALYLWVTPRILRNSSSSTPGVVDLDVHFIQGASEQQPVASLLRTLRIRVDSHPRGEPVDLTQAALVTGLALATGVVNNSYPLKSMGTIGAGTVLGDRSPPDAGYSLELMTELAVRQLIFLTQRPVKALAPAKGRGLLQQLSHPKKPMAQATEPANDFFQNIVKHER